MTIWEYKTSTPLSNRIIPENFGIFDGYENYSYKASSVVDLKKRWTELYKTSQGLEMYYDYEYTPRTIGAVSLSSYFNYITYKVPFPSMLIISTNLDTFSSSDKNVNSAKEQLKNIADTIELVVE